MPKSSVMTDLNQLRQGIDDIDDQVHDLLMRRITLVDQVRAAKSGAPGGFFRPAREAEILRRLVARNRGPLPKPVLVRIWREIMSAMLGLQGRFSLAVFAPEDRHEYWDLARDHFGIEARMTTHQSARGVVVAVREGAVNVGILPLPTDDEDDPWWPSLSPFAGESPTIVARLPVASAGDGQGERPSALVIGSAVHEPSASDRSFLVLRARVGVSCASLSDLLVARGFNPLYMFTREDDGDPSLTLFLVEVEGFVAAEDPRFEQFIRADESPVQGVDVLGAYATPFTQAELGAAHVTDATR